MNEPETTEPNAHSNPDQRAAQRRQLLKAAQAARRGVSKASDKTAIDTRTMGTVETPARSQSDQAEPIAEPEAIAEPAPLNETSETLRHIKRLLDQHEKESGGRLSRLEEMTPLYEDFAEAMAERLNRSGKQLEETVLALRRTEYLLGQVDERCQRAHELLSRVEMLIQNADGMLTASRRELQSEAAATRRYIARKLRFAPLLVLVAMLLLTVSALAWRSQKPSTAGLAPTAEAR